MVAPSSYSSFDLGSRASGTEEEGDERTPSPELDISPDRAEACAPGMWCSGEAVTAWAAKGKSSKQGKRPRRNRQRVNATQKRYRQRTKEENLHKQEQLKQMEEHMRELEAGNRHLARKQELLMQLVRTQEIHLCRLANHEEVKELETQILLQELASLVCSACDVEVTAEDAQHWTMSQWMHDLFPRYLRLLAELSNEAGNASARSHATQRLTEHVKSRRNAEARRGLFAHLHANMFAWNLAHTRAMPREELPTPQLWSTVLDRLKLSDKQQAAILAVRADVLVWFGNANALCNEAYIAIQQDVTWLTADNQELSEGMHMLNSAFELEFRAAAHFHWMLTQEILTPQQEAWLDAGPVVQPWCANLWAISELLAARCGHKAAPSFDALLHKPPALQSYLKGMTGFQLLTVDCTAFGAGTQLKRGVLGCWYLYMAQPGLVAPDQAEGRRCQLLIGRLETCTLESLQKRSMAELWKA